MKRRDRLAFARDFSETLADNEEVMGEGAAYAVTCEQMGVDQEDGYDLLIELSEEEDD